LAQGTPGAQPPRVRAPPRRHGSWAYLGALALRTGSLAPAAGSGGGTMGRCSGRPVLQPRGVREVGRELELQMQT